MFSVLIMTSFIDFILDIIVKCEQAKIVNADCVLIQAFSLCNKINVVSDFL